MTTHHSYSERVREVHRQYRRDEETFAHPADPPAPERATTLCRTGLGPTVMLYVDARTDDRGVRFGADEFALLTAALNGYLELYAACYGVDADPDATLREAAELLLDTHNVVDVAAVLTGVPDRTVPEGTV